MVIENSLWESSPDISLDKQLMKAEKINRLWKALHLE